MSTLNLENIKHPDSASNNISVDSSGNAIANGNLLVNSTSATAQTTVKQSADNKYQLHLEQANSTDGYGLICDMTDGALAFSRYASSAYTERMRIDSAGRVTMPYQPSFYAYASNSYSATTTNELVKFNATSFDTGNNFDISAGNHKFVAPVSGVYSFQSTINTYSVGVGSILRTDLYVNGSAVSRGDYMISDHTGDQNVSISVTRSLSANDYVQIYHISDDTSRGFSGNGTWVWFSGFLVG